MTIRRIYRCKHCLIPYEYYVTGASHWPQSFNDPNYCPNCKEFILNALENAPKRVERFMKPYDKITIEELKMLAEEERKKSLFTKICTPLYDMQDWDNHNVTGYITHNGQEIFYSYWTKKGDYRIEIEMERNLETGEECIWRDIRNEYS